MNYEEIKTKTKEMIGRQNEVTDEELENLQDELIALLCEANEKNSGELAKYVTDVKIYDSVKRRVSVDAEPRIVKKMLTDMRYELSRPVEVREIVKWKL